MRIEIWEGVPIFRGRERVIMLWMFLWVVFFLLCFQRNCMFAAFSTGADATQVSPQVVVVVVVVPMGCNRTPLLDSACTCMHIAPHACRPWGSCTNCRCLGAGWWWSMHALIRRSSCWKWRRISELYWSPPCAKNPPPHHPSALSSLRWTSERPKLLSPNCNT